MYIFAFTGCPSTSSNASETSETPRHLLCKRLITIENPPRLNASHASFNTAILPSPRPPPAAAPAAVAVSACPAAAVSQEDDEGPVVWLVLRGNPALQNSPSAFTKTRLMTFQSLLIGNVLRAFRGGCVKEEGGGSGGRGGDIWLDPSQLAQK